MHRLNFNPRSPRGGATFAISCILTIVLFQSTLPTRGSDIHKQELLKLKKDFNPRSPRGGATAFHSTALPCYCGFNPRSPRGGATIVKNFIIANQTMFQSTLPTRGSDNICASQNDVKHGFNPRSPRGGATTFWRAYRIQYGFQSTLPTRGSDNSIVQIIHIIQRFNPRSPRGGATLIIAD